MDSYLDEVRRQVLDVIPLVGHLGVELEPDRAGGVLARAPLEKNRNHRQTAFAASLNAVATLACWAMAYVVLKERGVDAEIVLQKSSIQYRRPVRGEIVAIAARPEAAEIETFVDLLERKKRGRLKVRASIADHGELAVSFKGKYAASIPDQGITRA